MVVYAAEVDASWVAVLGTLSGLAAGLLAPFVSQRAETRASRHTQQADLARAALTLFEGDQTLDALLRGTASATRRKLFLVANQLRDDEARRACIELVATAGDPGADAALVEDRWTVCIEVLGRVARSG